jgi:hypothetical protein
VMSMSTHVVGFRPPDKKWKAMKKLWDACSEAGVDPPKEVEEFFNYKPPDEAGVEVELPETCLKEYEADMTEGYEIDVTKLPKDVTVIRFYNSW